MPISISDHFFGQAKLHTVAVGGQLRIVWYCGLKIIAPLRRETAYQVKSPEDAVVKLTPDSNSFELALISSTSQFAQRDFPLRKAPSGLASQTEKCADS
jgi:hypothetical protein